jgi:hypothetical protein
VFDQRRSEASEATAVTLVVRQADAATVARFGSAGQIGIVVLPASGPVSVPVPSDSGGSGGTDLSGGADAGGSGTIGGAGDGGTTP